MFLPKYDPYRFMFQSSFQSCSTCTFTSFTVRVRRADPSGVTDVNPRTADVTGEAVRTLFNTQTLRSMSKFTILILAILYVSLSSLDFPFKSGIAPGRVSMYLMTDRTADGSMNCRHRFSCTSLGSDVSNSCMRRDASADALTHSDGGRNIDINECLITLTNDVANTCGCAINGGSCKVVGSTLSSGPNCNDATNPATPSVITASKVRPPSTVAASYPFAPTMIKKDDTDGSVLFFGRRMEGSWKYWCSRR